MKPRKDKNRHAQAMARARWKATPVAQRREPARRAARARWDKKEGK